MQEIRRHRRLEGPVVVEYHVLNGSGLSGCAPATNVSEGGIRFATAQAVPLHAPVELHLHVGRVGASPVIVQGQVVWARPGTAASPSASCEVGVAFDDRNARFVQRFVQRLYVYWQQQMRGERT